MEFKFWIYNRMSAQLLTSTMDAFCSAQNSAANRACVALLSLSLFLSLSRWFKRCNPKRMLSSKLSHGISHVSLPVFDQEVHLSPAATISSSLEITALLLLKINSATPDVWCPVSLPGSKCALHHTCWPVQKFDKQRHVCCASVSLEFESHSSTRMRLFLFSITHITGSDSIFLS